MEGSTLFRFLKKFDTDNPGKRVTYVTKDNDYLEQKAALDYLEERKYINIISVYKGFIEVELTEMGKNKSNVE